MHGGEGGRHTQVQQPNPAYPGAGAGWGLPTDSTEKVPSRETLSVPGLEEITPDLFTIRADVGKAHSPQLTAWSSSGSHNPERLTSLPRPSPMALGSRLTSEFISPMAAAPHWGGGGHLPRVPVQTLYLQLPG